jgi:hypothetical protein
MDTGSIFLVGEQLVQPVQTGPSPKGREEGGGEDFPRRHDEY